MKGSDTSGGFLSHTFTDLMASLAVIFILLTVVFIRQASRQSEKSKEDIRSSLGRLLQENQLPLKQDPKDPLSLSVSVGENVLKFALGSSTLQADGSKFIGEFMPKLTRQLCSEPTRSKIDAIIIEGHTDRSGELGSDGTSRNIKLSQNRSYAVLERTLQSVKGDASLTECLLGLSSATGRGSRSPVTLAGIYNPDLSRRVEIKIRVKSSEQEFLKSIGR